MGTDKIKIILVDDHYIVRNGIRALFDDVDEIEVIGEASNGVEAISKVSELRPDIAILDISMPQMNGLEVLEKLKANNSEQKVIMMTAYSTLDKVLKSHKEGATNYVMKPFDSLQALEKKILEVLKS